MRHTKFPRGRSVIFIPMLNLSLLSMLQRWIWQLGC